MNDTIFYKNFRFNEYRFLETRHQDNSYGVGFHFIGFMKQGRGRLVSGAQTLELAQGDLFYIPKGCKYHSYWIPEGTVCFDSIGFLFFPSSTPNGYSLQKIRCDQVTWDAFLPLSRDKSVTTSSIGVLYRFLGMIEPEMELAPNKPDAAMYEKLVLLMRKNPHLTIPEYAAGCGVSESLLYTYVKRSSGKTPNRLRQEILCQKAAKLLSTTSYTVEEICEKLEFSSPSYFRKVFESVYQKSPSQMRREENMI